MQSSNCYYGRANVSPKVFRLVRGIWTPILYVVGPKRICPSKPTRDRFIRFCTVHLFAHHTDTQITERAASMEIGHIYVMHAMRPKTKAVREQRLTACCNSGSDSPHRRGVSPCSFPLSASSGCEDWMRPHSPTGVQYTPLSSAPSRLEDPGLHLVNSSLV